MWDSGEDFDFGDEDDVGALLAKARMKVALGGPTGLPVGHAAKRPIQHTTSGDQANRLLTASAASDLGKIVVDQAPTVSSSIFSIKQRSESPQSSGDQSASCLTAQTRLNSRGQPLANVTNAILTSKTVGRHFPADVSQMPQSKRAVQVPPLTRTNEASSTWRSEPFKVPFLKGVTGQEKAGGNEATAFNKAQGRAPDVSRQFLNAFASTSGPVDSASRRRFDAAEKGKRILSEVEGGSKSAPARSPSASEGALCPLPPVIPGPAGAVQRALAQGRSAAEAQGLKASTSKQAPLSLEALPDEDFSKGPWLAALDFIRREEAKTGSLKVTQLRELRKGVTSKRIGHLVVIVKSMSPTGEGDMFATVKDPSGTLEGTLHRKLLADARLGPITAGTVLVLQQVAIFRPVPRTCYLNIVSSNVLKIFPTKTARPVSSGTLRASTDPASAEPSWGDVDLPTNSNSPKYLPRGHQSASGDCRDLPRNAADFDKCETPRSDNPSLRTSAEFERLKISEGAGLPTGLEDLLPELPSQRTGSSSGAVGLSETPDTPRLPSTNPSDLDGLLWGGGDRKARSSCPTVALPGATPRQYANHESRPAAANGRVPAGDAAATNHHLTAHAGSDANPPRDETVRTGPLDGGGPGHGAANLKRGRGALSVDIQQLLAGLDEEDWFMPGEEAPPSNKKSRELEESLPF